MRRRLGTLGYWLAVGLFSLYTLTATGNPLFILSSVFLLLFFAAPRWRLDTALRDARDYAELYRMAQSEADEMRGCWERGDPPPAGSLRRG